MQIMRAQAGLHGAKRSAAHNFQHYVPLPTTDPGWAGRTGPLPKPQTIGGRESVAPCGGAAGWATAEPASGPAQAATEGTQAGRSRRAGCAAAGGARFRHGVARCGAASPWPRFSGRRAPWRSAGGNEGAKRRTEPRSQSAGACGGSLAALTLARRSPARRLPAKHASGVTGGPKLFEQVVYLE